MGGRWTDAKDESIADFVKREREQVRQRQQRRRRLTGAGVRVSLLVPKNPSNIDIPVTFYLVGSPCLPRWCIGFNLVTAKVDFSVSSRPRVHSINSVLVETFTCARISLRKARERELANFDGNLGHAIAIVGSEGRVS